MILARTTRSVASIRGFGGMNARQENAKRTTENKRIEIRALVPLLTALRRQPLRVSTCVNDIPHANIVIILTYNSKAQHPFTQKGQTIMSWHQILFPEDTMPLDVQKVLMPKLLATYIEAGEPE